MKPPESLPPDDPRSWLRYARGDLEMARRSAPGVPLEFPCFHAQQAAEKAIKGLMIRLEVDFPYIHDLGALLAMLREAGEAVPESVAEAETLTPYAAATRYPGIGARMTEEDYAKAVRLAEVVVAWAEERLR